MIWTLNRRLPPLLLGIIGMFRQLYVPATVAADIQFIAYDDVVDVIGAGGGAKLSTAARFVFSVVTRV